MRLVTYSVSGEQRLGALVGGWVVDLEKAHLRFLEEEAPQKEQEPLPSNMLAFLHMGSKGMNQARTVLDYLRPLLDKGAVSPPLAYPEGEVTLEVPVPNPSKIIAIGRNYADHSLEQGEEPPEKPILFAIFPNSLIGPGQPVIHHKLTQRLDYEAELAFIIGRRASRVSAAEALDYVAGYTIFNDITARDLVQADLQWLRGKSLDSFSPMGPALVTPDEIGDPHNLEIKLYVNGNLKQDSNTRHLIFKIPQLIEFITQGITLEPGDIVTTGTPSGVGAFRSPPVFLAPGDEIRIEIEGLGALVNTVVKDPSAT